MYQGAAMDMKALERDYCAGILSIQAVADLYGVAKSTLRDWAKKFHWVRIRQPKHPVQNPSIRPDLTIKTDGRTDGRTGKTAETHATPADHKNDESVHSVDRSETKRNRSGNPNPQNQFQPGNQAAQTHGGYCVRSQHSDAIIRDAWAMTLVDEIHHLRCRSLEATETIGRCKTQLIDATDDEKAALCKLIEAADNAILRNIIAIQSLERTLVYINQGRTKLIADAERSAAASDKTRVETEMLNNHRSGVVTPIGEIVRQIQQMEHSGLINEYPEYQ